MAAKSFLRVIHKSIVFSDLVKERRREYLVQMQSIGQKSDMSRADSFFGM